MERKYKASTALRVLSLGIFQHAVSIKNGVLRTTCGFLFRIKPIKIENITYVECYAKKVWAKGGYVDETYYKFVVKGEVHTMADEAYTSHNTRRLDVDQTVEKIMTTDYIKEELEKLNNK